MKRNHGLGARSRQQWILVMVAVGCGLSALSTSYVLLATDLELPGVAAAVVLGSWIWIPGTYSSMAVMPWLVLPGSRGPLTRLVVAVAWVAIAVAVLRLATYPYPGFDNPTAVFPESMLKPETQDIEQFVDGIDNIVEAQQRVAKMYLHDGSVADLCPPLQALVHIMAIGSWHGMGIDDPKFRAMFSRESLLASDWYQDRLRRQQRIDTALLKRHRDYVQARLDRGISNPEMRQTLEARLAWAAAESARIESPTYVESLMGTIGADPLAG